MPPANTSPTTAANTTIVTSDSEVKTKKVAYDTVGPITEEDVVEGIRELITEWSAQNQGVAKIDVILGSFRTIVQTERTPVVD